MSKTKTSRARRRPRKTASAPKKALKQVDLEAIREQITNLVGNGAVEMVETTMTEVSKGRYLAMKYLFEMIGLCPSTAPEEAPEEDSLARTLLRRLQVPEEANPVSEVTKDCATDSAGAVEQHSDAVK